MPLEQVAQHRLEIALVGVFQDEDAVRREHAAHLRQHGLDLRHVMQHADHRRAVENAGVKRQMISVGGDVDVAIRLP